MCNVMNILMVLKPMLPYSVDAMKNLSIAIFLALVISASQTKRWLSGGMKSDLNGHNFN